MVTLRSRAIAIFPNSNAYDCADNWMLRLRASSLQCIRVCQSRMDQLLHFREHAFVIHENAWNGLRAALTFRVRSRAIWGP